MCVCYYSYPGFFGDVLDFMKPIMDIWGLLFRALGPSECFGVQGFTARWLLRVIGLPGVMGVIVVLIYFAERCRSTSDQAQALIHMKGNAFFVIFFCYPTVCIVSFAAFICTAMTPDTTVLDMDDAVICESSSHIRIQIASYIVIAVVAIGLPITLYIVLSRKSAAYSETANKTTAKRIALELDVEVSTVEYVIRDITIGRQFSFLMDAFKPRYLYWESMDMLRKLCLVGLVLIVGRGTIAQLSTAIILSFSFFALHIKTWPYKVHADNMFRAATELHVFICILVALVMKNDLGLETMQEGAYDVFLFISFLVLVPGAFFVCIFAKVSFVTRTLRERDRGKDDARHKRQRALALHVLGIGSDSDKEHLRRYIEGWLVKKSFAAFLSHYKSEAAAEARILKLELERGALTCHLQSLFLLCWPHRSGGRSSRVFRTSLPRR